MFTDLRAAVYWHGTSAASTLLVAVGVQGVPLLAVVPMWLARLCGLYFLCESYGRFKSTKPPTSLWRFL